MNSSATKVVAVVVAVVLAVSGIAVGLATLGGGDQQPTSGASEGPSDGGSADGSGEAAAPPYAATPCPDPLPNPAQAGLELPDLDRAVSVRLCGESADEVPTDALVEGLPRLADAVADLPAADTDLCAAAGTEPPTTVLVVETGDGRQVTVRTGVCAGILAGRTTVSGVGVTSAFLEALDAQRSDADAPAPAEARAAQVDCAATPAVAPVRPGRDGIASAALCTGPDAEPTELDQTAAAELTSAWASAPAPKADACDSPASPAGGFVVLRTELGDLVRLVEGCGGLVLSSTDLDAGGLDFVVPLTSVVPTTLADLGA